MAGMTYRKLALCAGALSLHLIAGQPVLADDVKEPTILEVFVTIDPSGDPSLNTLTIKGKNLLGRSDKYETRVMLGEQGPLEILPGATNSRITVKCFVEHDPPKDDFECNDGDYRLTVAIVQARKKRRKDDDDDDERHRVRGQTSYDLTIGGTLAGGCPCYSLRDVFTSFETSCGLTRLVNPPPGPPIFQTDRTSLPGFRFNVTIHQFFSEADWVRTCHVKDSGDSTTKPTDVPITPEEAIACSTIMETALGSCAPVQN